MKIKVENLGVIKRGEVDLSKRINVFCGPNGTGKTYMAYVIYGLLDSRIHYRPDPELARELVNKKNVNIDIDYRKLFELRNAMVKSCKVNLDSLFGIGADVAEEYFKNSVIEFVEDENLLRSIIKTSSIDELIIFSKINVKVLKQENTDNLTLQLIDDVVASKDVQFLEFALLEAVYSLLATYPTNSVHIFPVERNSIYTFSKELSIRKQEAIDYFHAMTGKEKVNKFELLFDKTNRYPKPIKDGLIIAEDLAEVKKTKSEYFDFATSIERELLHGQVNISSEGQILFISEKAPKRNLPIHMSASIVKALSSLVVYLKHIASKNDLIIIDEPEINLHPDNQIVLTKLFARLANNGFRLLISTHSDYIIREINNLVMLSSKEKKIHSIRQNFAYKEDEYIDKNNIDFHYFAFPNKLRGNKQVEIKTLELSQFGFDVDSIDKSIDNQNMVSEELFYTLNCLENE